MNSNDRPLTGRVAVISGAGSGLGRAHALTFAAQGAKVVVNDVDREMPGRPGVTTAEAVVEQIVQAGGEAIAFHASVVDEDAGDVIVAAAVDAFSRVDIVVNNAGVLRDRPFAKTDLGSWNEVLGTHLLGSYQLTRAAWPLMLDAGYGRVVFTSSAAGLFGTGGNASYGAAKMGVVGLMRMLAVESADAGIHVNAIAPLALTPMSQATGDRDRAADVVGDLFSRMPPEQVSQLLVWLCHEDSDVTGRIFSAGGGRIAEVYVAETRGWTSADHDWSDIRKSWTQITDRSDSFVPVNMADEMREFVRALAD